MSETIKVMIIVTIIMIVAVSIGMGLIYFIRKSKPEPVFFEYCTHIPRKDEKVL